MKTKLLSLRALLQRRANKREDVSAAEVSAAVTDATTEVTATIEEVLAAVDALLASPPENPEEIMNEVVALREQIAALVPDVEEIAEAVDEVAPSDGATATEGAERAAKKLRDAIEKIKQVEARAAKRNELRSLAQNNRDALASLRTGAAPLPLGGVGNNMTQPTFRRSRRFSSDAVALRMGRILQAAHGNDSAKRWLEQNGISTRAASLSDFATGGILVPEEVESEIVKYRDERGLARQICRVVDMTSNERKIRKQVDGPVGQYIGEGDSIATSDNIRYDEKSLNAKWAAIGTEWYTPVDEDAAISLADEFAEWCAYTMAGVEDTAVFSGTGLSATGGIIGMPYAFRKAVEDAGGTWTTDAHKAYHPGLRVATGSTWASITASDVQSMGANLAHRQGIRREFVCSSQFYYERLQVLALSAAGVQPSSIVDGEPRMLFNGFVVHLTDNMPQETAVSTIPLLFGDFQSYVLGNRKGLTIESDKNIKTQLITTVATWRYGGLALDWGTASSSSSSRQRGGIAALVTKNS